MAIVNSLAIGKSVKSAGNLTYKTVRGRTIASQRITQNLSNTEKQMVQREAFSKVSQSMQICQSYINALYEKSKYGSARNQFQKVNKKFKLGGLVGEIKEGIIDLAEGFVMEMSKPTKGLNFGSYGSLPCIVSATYQTASFKYSTETELPEVYSMTGNSTFTFPNGVKETDVDVVVVGIYANKIAVSRATIDTNGKLRLIESADDDLQNDFSGQFGTSTATVNEGVVSAINVVAGSNLDSTSFKVMFIVPRVSGKIATINAGYLGNPAT